MTPHRSPSEKPLSTAMALPALLLALATLLPLAGCRDSEVSAGSQAQNAFQLVTGADTEEEQKQWDHVFRSQNYVYGTRPNQSLASSLPLLPPGRALVLPMEEGRNAVFLARNGFEVSGVDFSEVALQKAKRLAREHRVSVTGINADLNSFDIEPARYDVIVDLEFHRPRLVEQIKRGLRKGGVVVYESVTHPDEPGPEPASARDRWLHPGALREYFRDFEIMVYRQETRDGRPYETLIARKIN